MAGESAWIEKPACWGYENASAFEAESVARAYRHRPPYPPELFGILDGLIRPPRRVLDVGCGNGLVARPLAPRVDALDALDLSAAMIAEARELPGGTHPHITWIIGRAEDAPLRPPYGLITAGESLHWMEWDVVLPRFAALLTPGGRLAIVNKREVAAPWADELAQIIPRYSTIRNFSRVDMIRALEQRGLFRTEGTQELPPVRFRQSLDDYIEGQHSQSSFSRERMPPEAAAAFDAEVRALVGRFAGDTLDLQVETRVVWGTPLAPAEGR